MSPSVLSPSAALSPSSRLSSSSPPSSPPSGRPSTFLLSVFFLALFSLTSSLMGTRSVVRSSSSYMSPLHSSAAMDAPSSHFGSAGSGVGGGMGFGAAELIPLDDAVADVGVEYRLARDESYGLLTDVPEKAWRKIRSDLRKRRRKLMTEEKTTSSPPQSQTRDPINQDVDGDDYRNKWAEEEFECPEKVTIEGRLTSPSPSAGVRGAVAAYLAGMGTNGDGNADVALAAAEGRVPDAARAVLCLPRGIVPASRRRTRRRGADKGRRKGDDDDDGCLIYSSVETGPGLSFETALAKAVLLPQYNAQLSMSTKENDDSVGIKYACEIESFRPKSYAFDPPYGVTVHSFGFSSHGKERKSGKRKDDGDAFWEGYKKLSETVKYLGHGGRTIDALIVDCGGAGCEWDGYEDWFRANVTINQIAVKLHGSPPPEVVGNFFRTLRDNGYAAFHSQEDETSSSFWSARSADERKKVFAEQVSKWGLSKPAKTKTAGLLRTSSSQLLTSFGRLGRWGTGSGSRERGGEERWYSFIRLSPEFWGS